MTFKKKKCFADTVWFSGGRSQQTPGCRSATTLRISTWLTPRWKASTTPAPRVILGKMLAISFVRSLTIFVTGCLKAREWTRSGLRRSTPKNWNGCLLQESKQSEKSKIIYGWICATFAPEIEKGQTKMCNCRMSLQSTQHESTKINSRGCHQPDCNL